MNYVKEVSFHHQVLQDLGVYHNPKFIAFFTDLAVNTSNPNAQNLSVPVVDRFAHLLICLAKPDAYKMTPYLEQKLAEELQIVYGSKKMIVDEQYMLKFQAVSLAKHHNFYGKMDKYVKEFSRIVLDMGDRQLINNLQSLLQSEVALP